MNERYFCLVEQVDLFAFPPVCLPLQGQDFAGLEGIVAGGGKNIVHFTFSESALSLKDQISQPIHKRFEIIS